MCYTGVLLPRSGQLNFFTAVFWVINLSNGVVIRKLFAKFVSEIECFTGRKPQLTYYSLV